MNSPIELVGVGVFLVVSIIIRVRRDKIGGWALRHNPNSLFLPLIFDYLLKRKWKVILFVVIVGWVIGLTEAGVPFGVAILLYFFLVPITVSLLGRMVKANIWKDDKPPSVVVA